MRSHPRVWPIVACLLLVASSVSAQSASLVEFEIKDQFDQVYRSSDYAGRVLYVIGSDKAGSEFNGLWAQAIRAALEPQPGSAEIAAFGLADLGGVPRLVRGMVRRAFPKDERRAVLLDWQGVFAETYEFAPKSSNILVFAPDGRLVHRAHGREVEQEVLDGIVTELRRLLGELADEEP